MSESFILYSFRRCPFAMRVRVVLEEKNIPYQVREEDLGNRSNELLAMHPQGKVPLLVHILGDLKHVLYQSTIITEYLDELMPQNLLMPKSAIMRAKVRMWSYWCDTIFKPDLDLFKYKFSTLTNEESLLLKKRLNDYLSMWDKSLKEELFMIGNDITLADIHLFPFARQFLSAKVNFPGIENYQYLAKWLERMVNRPSFINAMKK